MRSLLNALILVLKKVSPFMNMIDHIKKSFEIDDDDFAWECVTTFDATMRVRRDNIIAARKQNHTRIILEEAHTIKSSSLLLGEEKLSKLAFTLENDLLNKEDIIHSYPAFLAELDVALEKAGKLLAER